VPTVLSTGAIIHGFVADWEGRKIVGTLAEIDCKYVLVDYGIIKQGPLHLNTAGIGDVLCGYSGISEWRYSAAKGLVDPVDDEKIAPVLAHFDEIVNGFAPTLEDDGSLSDESVRVIMKAVQDRDDRMLKDKRAPTADHSFSFGIEIANDKYWTHGEACALGAVIVAWHTNQSPETLVGWLDQCKVQFRPSQMEISKEELRKGLDATIDWLQRGGTSNSVIVTEPIVGARFEECWSWLSAV
jgi:glycerol dehydrogenase-like iron-containing ADH family enzyme